LARSFAFKGPKKLYFQGPTLTMALVMDIARLKIITSCAIKTTGILKGLSHEIDFKNFDKNLQNLA
jgi:hypothetical protein